MRFLVTGARGFLGRHLVSLGRSRGHTFRATSRSAQPIEGVEQVILWDPVEGPAPSSALEGVDAVVHLAGESVGNGRWTGRKMARIRESRVEGTRNLLKAVSALQARPRCWIQASAIGFYGDGGDRELDERSGPGRDFLAQVCLDWEREGRKAEGLGIRTVIARFGIVLGRDGGALPRMVRPFRIFLGGPIAGGSQWISWIHVRDAVELVLTLAESDSASGVYNVTAPAPVTNRQFSRALGAALGRPAFFPTPGWILRIALGKFARTLTMSQRVVPRRALEAGFRFRFAELEKALQDLLGEAPSC